MSKFLNPKYQDLEAYTPGEQPQGFTRLIKLNTNENPYPPSPAVQAALQEEKDFRLYPDPLAEKAVRAIASYYGLSKNEVAVGNGSDEILAFAYMAFGQRIAFPAISYGFYPVFAEVFGCEATPIPLREDFSIGVEDYEGFSGTVIIANPNAPTGMVLTSSQIRQLLEQDPNRLVIVDEAYVDFGAESVVPLIHGYDNLLVVQTMSKSRSLAGMRVGMALGSSPLIEDLNRMKYSFNPYNLSRDAIVAAAAAIGDKAYFDETRQKIMDTREWFVEELKKLGISCLPSKANFVFAKTGAAYYQAMRQQGIIVRHFDKDPIRDYVRITIGTREDMEALLAATVAYKEGTL